VISEVFAVVSQKFLSSALCCRITL